MNDAIDTESRPLAVVEERAPESQGLALFSGEPDEVIARAVKVADALKRVVETKGLVKRIQGREFIEVAGWQTLGSMVGVTAFCEWSRAVEGGWEARVVVRRYGADIGAAEAQCTRRESAWKNRDDYAIRSMAQTRATSKALRAVLGFIVVLAGYRDTPAEEIPEDASEPAARQGAGSPATSRDTDTPENRKRGSAAVHALIGERGISKKLYRELLLEMFPDVFSDPAVEVSSKALAYKDLRALYRELKDRTEEPA